MERLTFRHDAPYSKFHQKAETCEPVNCIDEYSKAALDQIVSRLAAYEDTGFTPEEVQANKDAEEQGLAVRLPFSLHSTLLNMSNKERPELMKDFRLSATWTHCGIVFHSPLEMFLQDVEREYIQLVSEEAEKALGEENGNGCG